jgi:hypothetical protein
VSYGKTSPEAPPLGHPPKEKLNKTGQGDKIQSTKKSEQRLKNQLKKIQSLKDVED